MQEQAPDQVTKNQEEVPHVKVSTLEEVRSHYHGELNEDDVIEDFCKAQSSALADAIWGAVYTSVDVANLARKASGQSEVSVANQEGSFLREKYYALTQEDRTNIAAIVYVYKNQEKLGVSLDRDSMQSFIVNTLFPNNEKDKETLRSL